MLQYLIEGLNISVDDRGFNTQSRREDGWSALSWAVFGGKKACVEYLVQMGASEANAPNAMLLATKVDQEDIALFLLEKGYATSFKDEKGFQALHLASEKNMVKLAKVLIEKQADINKKTDEGWTPLLLAAYHGRDEICRALIEAGADREAEYQGKDAVKWARKQGYKDLAKYIKKPEN